MDFNFKNYVRMMLEAEKAKDQDEDVEDQNDEDEDSDEDDEDEDDEGKEASVKTKSTGCEASADTDDEDSDEDDEDEDDEDEDEDSDEDEDEDEEKCPKCGKSPCECKKENTIRESARRLASNSYGRTVISEEVMVLNEGIKNNSASKYLSKLAKRAEKEAAKFEKKGIEDAAATSKKAAKSLKEASNKLYKCEVRYQGGDASAKREYKMICKQYSKELKGLGKTARGLKGLVFTLVAGALLLGAVGTTVMANDDLIKHLDNAIKTKDVNVFKQVAKNDATFVKNILTGSTDKSVDLGDVAAETSAKRAGWESAAERKKYTEEGLGGAIKKGKETLEDFGKGFSNFYKGGAESFKKNLKGAAESARR